MAVVRKPAIPAPGGNVERAVDAIKEAVEIITGARPGVGELRALPDEAGFTDIVAKLNEITQRLNASGQAAFEARVVGDRAAVDAETLRKAVELAGGSSGGSGGTTPTTPPVVYPPVGSVSNLVVANGLSTCILSWDVSSIAAVAYVEIWRSTTTDLSQAKLIGTSTGVAYSDALGVTSGTFYYWIRPVGRDPLNYTPGAWSSGVGTPGTPGKVGNIDLGPLIVEAANIANGAIGSGQLASGAVTTAKFASSIEPVTLVSAVPTVKSTTTIYNSADGKLYRWNGTAYTATTPAVDITGQLTDAQIAALDTTKLTGLITATQITDKSISTPKLAAGAVTAAELAAGSVVAGKIAAAAVSATEIAANAITSTKIAAGAVVAGAIAADAIGANNIIAGSITGDRLAAATITGDRIKARDITAGNLAAGTITGYEIAGTTITGTHIAGATITGTHIAGSTITGDKIVAGTLTANLIDGRGLLIKDANGTTLLGGGTALNWSNLTGQPAGIYNSNIGIDANGSLTGIGTGSGTTVDNSKLVPSINAAALTAQWVSIGGKPVFGGFAGLDKITGTNIGTYIDSAAIDSAYINNLHGNKIIGGTIVGDKIAGNTITGDKIVANSIEGTQIKADTVTTTNLVTNAVTRGAGVVSTTEAILTLYLEAGYQVFVWYTFEQNSYSGGEGGTDTPTENACSWTGGAAIAGGMGVVTAPWSGNFTFTVGHAGGTWPRGGPLILMVLQVKK